MIVIKKKNFKTPENEQVVSFVKAYNYFQKIVLEYLLFLLVFFIAVFQSVKFSGSPHLKSIVSDQKR